MDLTGVGALSTLADDIINKVWPDPAKQAEAKAALLTAENQGLLKQLDDDFQLSLEQIKANAAEAAQPGMHFRDGAGWVCVIGFALMVLKAPIEWACTIAGHPITLPTVDGSVSNDMLFGLLGLGGMHVFQQTATTSAAVKKK